MHLLLLSLVGCKMLCGCLECYWNGVSYTHVFGHSGISLFGNRVSEMLCFV